MFMILGCRSFTAPLGLLRLSFTKIKTKFELSICAPRKYLNLDENPLMRPISTHKRRFKKAQQLGGDPGDADRLPRRMDCRAIHVNRSEVGMDLKTIRMNREKVDIGPKKIDMD